MTKTISQGMRASSVALGLARAAMASLLAFALCFCVTIPAHAEESAGLADTWKVTFNGSSMENTFETSELNDIIAGMQPGDHVTFEVSILNDSDITTDWYMKNAVLKTLEETQSVANGGAYTYILSYDGPSGTNEVIYDSDTVGGEGNRIGSLGLHNATSSLEDYFYLDQLNPGQGGVVKLYVALDGETQGNAYEDTFAQLEMSFAVERVQNGAASGDPIRQTTRTGMQQTGDDMMYQAIIFGIIGACGLILLIIALIKSRKREDER